MVTFSPSDSQSLSDLVEPVGGSDPGSGSSGSTGLILGVVFGLAAVIAIAAILVVLVLRRRKQEPLESEVSHEETDFESASDFSEFVDVLVPDNIDDRDVFGEETGSVEEEDMGEEAYSEVSYHSEVEPSFDLAN
jgi:hypothetical protein